jgi:hypothetical protein
LFQATLKRAKFFFILYRLLTLLLNDLLFGFTDEVRIGELLLNTGYFVANFADLFPQPRTLLFEIYQIVDRKINLRGAKHRRRRAFGPISQPKPIGGTNSR